MSLVIESLSVDSLSLDPNNARIHPERNLEAIKSSLVKFGQQKPIVIDADGVVIAGNGTLAAVRLLGWERIDAVRTRLKGAEAKAFALADNRTSELAGWDEQQLAETLRYLSEIESEGSPLIEATGFDVTEVQRYLRIDANKEADGAREIDEEEFSSFAHQCPKCGFGFDD